MNLGKAAIIKQKQNVVSSPTPRKCNTGVTIQHMRRVSLPLQFSF